MKIYTRQGDTGKTSLVGGTRISKSDSLIQAYGTVDQLNSYVGLVKEYFKGSSEYDFLSRIQHQLFNVGALLACEQDKQQLFKLTGISKSEVEELERKIDEMEEKLTKLTQFILPGGNVAAAFIHITRTTCRDAETKVVYLVEKMQYDFNCVVMYLNRLSDYFFVLARYRLKIDKVPEVFWNPKI
ncbi:MAG: cob(I)yrinic acid a,c-diamide adenosyltransferase [Sediminibacterium sp.]|nr:cob(I)yrinic acid a,c-diamide adenosyltransferase [Sediminibacterium sp.]